jgi:hypothetical protein
MPGYRAAFCDILFHVSIAYFFVSGYFFAKKFSDLCFPKVFVDCFPQSPTATSFKRVWYGPKDSRKLGDNDQVTMLDSV